MELGALTAALVRRWYLVVVAVLLAAGVCFLTFTSVGPTYETRATVLLFPPSSDGSDEQTSSNPYLELSGLNSARDILIRTLTSQSERDALAELHPDADYALVPDATSSGPMVVAEVSAPTAAQALSAQASLLDEVPTALDNLQTGLGLSEPEHITARNITVDDRAKVVHKSQIRTSIVATVAVLVTAFALIGLLDGLLLARAQSRGLSDSVADVTHDTDEDAAHDGDGGRSRSQDVSSAEPPDGPRSEGSSDEVAARGTSDPTADDGSDRVRRTTGKRQRKQARRPARDAAPREPRTQRAAESPADARPTLRELRDMDRAGA